jgi:predicted dehydrogenase
MNESSRMNRRDFIKTSALASAATAALMTTGTFAAPGGSDKLKIALIGCGGRGTGAISDCLTGSKGLEVVALADLYPDRLNQCLNHLQTNYKESCKVTPDTCFTGFDAYKQALQAGPDIVILATPPGFRPIHLAAAIEAGKHVFMEKPVAVDPVGVRKVIDASMKAKTKGLAIVAGTQRRHSKDYIETMKRIHDGAIGEIITAQVYWNQGGLWANARQDGQSDMDWQIRNWLYFTWLSGDHIVEQHVHNLDVANWAFNAHPVKALALGGRQCRVDPVFGHIYDHFAVEYEYPNGAKIISMCRQIDNCASMVGEQVVGTKGKSNCCSSITSTKSFNYDYDALGRPTPYVQEHIDFIASIRTGKPLNEGVRIAESTMTAVIGRMSAYTGQEVQWDWAMKQSTLDLSPEKYEFGPIAVPSVAMPGKDKLI